MMNIIIFTGAPATGKSAVSEECSCLLKIPVFSKDGYKIELFEKYGFTNHDEKKKLSILAEGRLMDTIEEFIIADKDIIIDNNFKEYQQLRKIIKESGKAVNVICFCLFSSNDKLADRYNERIQQKKRPLPLYVLNQYPIIDGITEYHKPLDAIQVANIKKNTKEETYGDVVFYVSTEEIETQFDIIVKECLDKIHKNLKEN